jgi:RNA:NAD 2'-phosphotransferase (TPT1/KptA family)
MNGQKIQVDIRDAGKSKYSRTPLDPSEPHQPSIEIRRKKGPKLKGRDADGADVQISKTLAWLLRHAADRESLGMRPDGYVRVQDLVRPRNSTSVIVEHLRTISSAQ